MRLFWFPGNANLTPHIVLEELGLPYELEYVDRNAGAHKSAAYLALNPAGRIPVLVDGDLVVFETAAIVLHLVDKAGRLAPRVGTSERATFYQWLMYLTNTVQAEAHAFFYPAQHTEDPAPAAVAATKAAAERRWGEQFALLDRQLDGRTYLLGETYTAVDPYLLMLVRWGRFMAKPPRELPNLRRHAETLLARPAVQRAFAAEGLKEPLI